MICLVNLPQPNSVDDRLDPPLGLMYIAGYLRSQGVSVKIVDLPFVKKEDWSKEIGYADVYGITVFSSSLYLAIEVAKIAKENNPKCKVVVGGPHPTALSEETLELFDCVVKGEGEYAFSRELEGIIQMPLIEDLDALPMPARDLVPMKLYTRKIFGNRATSVATSRGCPYSCAFCCKDVFGHRVRKFSITRVIEEIKQVITDYGIKTFIFMDDTFVLNRNRLYPMLEEIEKLNITFSCNGDARHNTLEDFKRLYQAGCRSIAFGIESGSQKILNMINKKVTVEQNQRALREAKEAGLIAKAYLMVGAPGESKETIEETKQFITQSAMDQFTLFTFVPLPGCDVWKHPDKYGVKIVSRDFKEYYNIAGDNDGGIVIENTNIKELRDDLVHFLRQRGQRGPIQDYYKRMEPQSKGVA